MNKSLPTIDLARALGDLSASEDRYRKLFHAEPIPTFVCDARTLAIVDANESAVRRYGYAHDDLTALRLHDLHPEIDQRRMEAYVTARGSRPTHVGEWLHVSRDGKPFEVELICSPLDGQAREVLLVVAYDISDRKRAEGLFRAAFEVSPNGLIMSDRAGTVLMINRQIEAIFGYAESELVGRPIEVLLPPALHAAHVEQRATFHQRPLPHRMGARRELVGIHKAGHEVPVEIGLSPTTRGGETLVLASVIDITERLRVEQAMREAAARWSALLESAMDGISLISREGIILEVNRRMTEIAGRPAEEMVGHHIGEFTAQGESEDSLRQFGDAVQRGSGHVIAAPLARPDGKIALVDFAVSTLELGGQPVVLSIGRDVTEHRMLEQQYRQAQKMEAVGRLAGGVAHDFNNLLTAIMGYADLLSLELPDGSQGRSDLTEITRAAERAAGLTRQLLAFSRQQVLEPVVLHLNAVVTEIENMLRRLIGEDVTLVTVLSPTLGNVLADPGQLEQVLMNLAVNARDAMPTGGTLTIETADVELTDRYAGTHRPVTPGHYIMLAMTDTGVGITEEVRARVFEPFFTTKEQGKGTGLGLSTVYGIVKQSGGFIWVYGEPGHGATFKVYLPRVEASTDAPRERPPTGDLSGSETILLAEDDDLLRPLARSLLLRSGYTVLDAPNANEALSIARAHIGPIHLLLTDMVLPGESGRILSERLLQERPSVRVLFMSGYTDDTIVRHGQIERGMAFLQKPFTPDALARKVRETLAS